MPKIPVPIGIKKGQGALAPGQLKDFSEDYGQAIENSFDLEVNCNIELATAYIKTMVFQPFHDEIKITVVKQLTCVFQRRLQLFER